MHTKIKPRFLLLRYKCQVFQHTGVKSMYQETLALEQMRCDRNTEVPFAEGVLISSSPCRGRVPDPPKLLRRTPEILLPGRRPATA